MTAVNAGRLPDAGEITGRAHGEAQSLHVVVLRRLGSGETGTGLVDGAARVAGDAGVRLGVDAALDGRHVGRELAPLGIGEVAAGGGPLGCRRPGPGVGRLDDHGLDDREERRRRRQRTQVAHERLVCLARPHSEGAGAASVVIPDGVAVTRLRARAEKHGTRLRTAQVAAEWHLGYQKTFAAGRC